MAVFVLLLLGIPAQAMEITAPTVPSFAEEFMVTEPENLLEGVRQVLKSAAGHLLPDMREASRVCIGMITAVMVVSLIRTIPADIGKSVDLAGTAAIAGVFLSAAGALIELGAETVTQISEYGKLLLPVMTAALAAQGGVTASTALYTVTAMFDALLSSMISNVLLPLLYLFLAVCVAYGAVGESVLQKIRDGMKWLMIWLLKTILYVFTGFIGITGVVSGPTDAATLKAAKLTISGFVPIVGGILSDASEAVLVSAGLVKNAVGLYGLFAILAIWIGPFLRIGAHYLLLRFTVMVCSILGNKRITELIQDLAAAMGFLLAMTGSVCLMLLISTVCFMKGVT